MEYLTFTIKVSSDFLSNENFFDLFSLLGCSSSSSVGNFSSPDSVSVKYKCILRNWNCEEKLHVCMPVQVPKTFGTVQIF